MCTRGDDDARGKFWATTDADDADVTAAARGGAAAAAPAVNGS
jgi:hypothetical protein